MKSKLSSATIMEKMFFTRNSEAERSMLLMTRRPSATTDGRQAKLDSSSTIWDFHANINIFDSCDDVDASHDVREPEKIFRKHLTEAMEYAEVRAEKQKADRALRRKIGDI